MSTVCAIEVHISFSILRESRLFTIYSEIFLVLFLSLDVLIYFLFKQSKF